MNTMHHLLQFGFQNALVATLLAAGVFLVTRYWRNPLLGRTLWLLVLIKLITPPLWEMPLPLPATAEHFPAQPPMLASEFSPPATSSWIDDGVSRGPDGALTTQSALTRDLTQAQPAALTLAESTRPTDAVPATSIAPPSAATAEHKANSRLTSALTTLSAGLRSVSPWSLAGGLWLSGSLILLLLIGRRTGRFARHLRQCSPASATEHAAVAALARQIGLRAPDVRISTATHPPLVWSMGWRPVLVLPRSLMQQLNGDEQTMVLAHELAHIRRGDHLVRLLEAAVVTLFWWHPVVWWARRELQRCEEQCCDAEVLRICPDCSDTYVSVLVKTVEFLQARRPVAVAFTSAMAQRHSLIERIERILGENRPAHWSWASRLTAFALLALLPLSIGIGDDAPLDVERTEQDLDSAAQPATGPVEESETAKTVERGLDVQDAPSKRLETKPDGSGHAVADQQPQLIPFDRPYGEFGFPGGQYGPHWETVRLTTDKNVQDELGLSVTQRRALAPVYASLMLKDGQWSRGGDDRPNLLKEEYDRTRSILTDEQKQRLNQIIFRRLGFTAFLQADYANQIGLTPEQSERFQLAWNEHVYRARQGWEGDAGRQAYHKLQAETFAALTPQQRERYAELIGEPVRVEPPTATDVPRPTPPSRSTLMPEFVNDVLHWLPTDIETLIVSRDLQARSIRDDANWKKSLAEPDFFRTLTRSLAAPPLFDLPPFTDKQIEWAILGGRNYEFTSAFGGYRFDGCSVLRFSVPILTREYGPRDNAYRNDPVIKTLEQAAQERWSISGNSVFVFPGNTKEREAWVKPRTGEGLYVAILHDARTMILATSDVFLLQTLRGIDSESLDRAMPSTLPEWDDIDFAAGTWGIRRVPERTPTGEPTKVASVVWTSIHNDEQDEALAVLYRPRENADLLEALREQWLQTEDPDSGVIRVVQEADQRCLVTIEPTANTRNLLPGLLFPIQGLPATSF